MWKEGKIVITSIFCDGGCVTPNPSKEGGTWAYCFVDHNDHKVAHASGLVTPEDIGLPAVTNNFTEFYAALRAMEMATVQTYPVTIYTDSLITLRRLERPKFASMRGIPDVFIHRLRREAVRLAYYTVVLLSGHPTEDDLKLGFTEKGRQVSKWNVFCDELCQKEAWRAKTKNA